MRALQRSQRDLQTKPTGGCHSVDAWDDISMITKVGSMQYVLVRSILLTLTFSLLFLRLQSL